MPTIQFRRGTAAQWRAANPVLNSGEPGFETDTGLQKIGDGANTWDQLSYLVDEENAREIVDEALSRSGAITSTQVASIRVMTQADFDGITPLEDVLYVVVG